MENKAWLWRKRSLEKTIVVNDKVNPPLVDDQEEKLVNDNTLELERSVKNLNDKLFSALSECNAKSELATKHAKMAEEALAGWEKAEAEAMSFKEELDEALRQKAAKDERISHLDAALKECMQQLRFVREDKEQRIHDVVTKTAKESEKIRMVLEEKLSEASKRLAKLNKENNHLSKVLDAKEKLVEDFNKRNSQAESDFNALMSRLDSTEKTNNSLQYELCMLEKELEIRHEEKEFNRRLADVSQKQHLESLKNISRLEAECQKLRLLVRKRLPGPAALAKMKTEVEMLGRESTEMRRRSSSPLKGSMVKGSRQDNSMDSPSKRTNYLMDRLCAMEEENKTLKETLSKKNDELQSSRTMSTHTASNKNDELQSPRNTPISHGFSNRNEDAESWDSTPISELEHLKNEKPRGSPSCKSVGVSDISLMDDFVEMEKLAIVSMDKSFGSSHVSDESNTSMRRLEYELGSYPSKETGKELVPVGFTDKNHELLEKDVSAHKYPGWLEEILRMILEQSRVTKKSLDEILRDIITALGMGYMNNPALGEVIDAKKNSSPSCPSGSPQISGYISWRSPNSSPVVDSFDHASDMNILLKRESTQQSQSSLSKSLCKLVELIEGIINQPSAHNSSQHSFSRNDGSSVPYSNIATPAGYMVRVFQWKSSELIAVLQQFSHTCNDLLNGKADVEQFTRELTSSFDWIMNHCFSLQDVSSMRDTIKKHFDWDESQSENELGVGMNSTFSEAESDRNLIPHLEEKQSNLREENKMLKDELERTESENKDLEGRVQSATDKIEGLMIQLQESENSIANLQKELETLKESKEKIEDQIENYKLLDEDLSTQLTVARGELSEARQKFSSLEVELDDRSNCCRELEATCLELQLQLESMTKKEPMQYGTDQEERHHQTDWKITAASEKLAECQETILNLGKQLKALSSPREAVMLDKVISIAPDTTTTTTTNHVKNKTMSRRASLLDQMLAEDDPEVQDLNSPKMKEIICTMDAQKPPYNPSEYLNSAHDSNGSSKPIKRSYSNETRYKTGASAEMALAIVPSKKRGSSGGLFRKLLSRRKRGSSKMPCPWLHDQTESFQLGCQNLCLRCRISIQPRTMETLQWPWTHGYYSRYQRDRNPISVIRIRSHTNVKVSHLR